MSKKLEFKGSVSSMDEDQIHRALRFINKCKYCVIGTVDPQQGVHLAILTTQEKEALDELWFVTPTDTRKVENIRRDGRCELLYTDNDNQINLVGRSEIVMDPEKKKELADIWVKLYVGVKPESDQMALIRFVPEQIDSIVK